VRVIAAVAEAFIALGGNVGDVRATFDRAVAMLCDGAAVRLAARSADYRTPPWGVTDQPPFVNTVIAVTTSLPPHDLLARAQRCERALGRDRTHERRWGPRVIDLDLLAYDDLVLDEPDLTLPHPLLLERAFVLVPLAEIAPDRMIAGVRVREALERVDARGIEKLPRR
jgi:2-amino-4-hydroxy-6-hydroxymethyldihydropteridine diphosphokinase